MTVKLPLQRYIVIIFLALLTACGTAPPAPRTPSITATPIFELLPSPTVPTSQPARTPLPAVLPKFPLDGYVMLFTKDGDLYFQDGENAPVKLAHAGEPNYKSYYSPRLSDDNQKVVFSQNDGNIYSINTDGTQKQVIVPSNWSASLEAGTFMGVLNFVPQTHLLFFEAMLCKDKSSVSLCSTTIFLADVDTGKIKKLADLDLALQNHDANIQDNIRFSPDGKMMAVGTAENIKIYTLDGKIIRQNILPFKPSKSEAPFPSLFWLPDSSALIAALPNTLCYTSALGYTVAYTVWQYSLKGNSTFQTPFTPPIIDTFEVSPDGNWIVYYGGLPSAEYEIYLGNLVDGGTKAIGQEDRRYFSWSPDSKHFIRGSGVVISLDKPPVYGVVGASWIDSNHFIGHDSPTNNPVIKEDRILIAEIKGNEIYYYESEFSYPRFRFWLMKPKR